MIRFSQYVPSASRIYQSFWSIFEMRRSRDIRRHNLSRMKAKARRIGREHKTKDVERAWVRFANNLQMCQRFCCNRQRFHFGPCSQELKALARWEQDLNLHLCNG